MQNIRNFSIIAHVDHGKSTISDQFIQICGSLTEREMSSQVLDSMDLEKERGITIKARNVTMNYHSKDLNKTLYQLNLIDTPGHVNFSYEVSRSLSACEGAILIVDASQGVEAQTLANCKLAMAMNLKIIPVLNKIDLITADIQKISEQINNLMGFPTHQIMKCSAKTGTGMIKLINKIITDIPSPKGNQLNPLQALIIDSWFDNYLGVISLICIKNGHLSRGQKIQIMSNKKVYKVESLGIFSPKKIQCNFLNCGQIGWIHCNIKNLTDILVGDTITLLKKP
ncbi:GTP-binding protein, partial [Buchnera aphidicola (Hormaphis cornu)]